MAGPRFKPPLDDRHDKCVFFLAFGVGFIGICVTRWLGVDDPLSLFDVLAIGISLCVIAAYTFYIVRTKNRSSISVDRAGDNAYYLGLLFTLISLCFTLVNLFLSEMSTTSGGNRVLSLLPDFGLALLSTIGGILARISVQQFRNDPADIETQARQELGEAVRSLRASLLQAASDMNNTSRAVNVAMTEVMSRTSKTVEETTEANVELISRLGQKVDDLTSHFSDQVRQVSEGLKRLADEVGAAVSHMKGQSLELNIDGSSVQQGLESVATELVNLRQKMEATKEGCQSLSDELSSLTGRFANVIPEDIVTQLQSVGSDVLERQRRLASQFGTLENDITQVSQSLGGVGDRVSRATEGVEQVGNANQNLTSQLEGAATQLAEGQQKILSEFDSLEEKIQLTGESLKQVPRNIGAAQPSFQSQPISGLGSAPQGRSSTSLETGEQHLGGQTDHASSLSGNEKPEDEPDVLEPRKRWFRRLFR